MSLPAYTVGDAITITWTLSGDPNDLTIQVKQGSDDTVTYTFSLSEITRMSEGIYTKTFLLTTAGRGIIECQATGVIQKVESYEFEIKPQIL